MALELITACLGLFSDPIKKYIVTPLKNHISYAFTCDSNVERLHHEVEKLQTKRDRLQQSVDDATRNGENIFPNVTEWLSIVKTDMEDAEKLILEKEESKKKCCSGFCPNLKTRYEFSKKAHKKALAINEKLQNAQGLNPIAFRPPPQPIVEPSMYTHEALPSRVLILNRIMDALKDPNLNMIGVYGMGGVGKTTLAKEVLRQAVEQKWFDDVVLVAVSQTPDLRRIQGEIADALGLKFGGEEVPGRASRLHQRLNKAKVLIILDDVWQKLDLNAVGISVGDVCEGCKILLTSRRKEVLSSEMCTQKEFPLDVLKEEETWRLFEMSVSMANNLELRALATEVAKKCAGLPLLIKKVATDLRNKDVYAWKDMLTQLSISENTEIYEKVHKVIESSYEKLIDEEAKSLFLLCSLFGSSNIRIHDLLVYCMGLSLFKHMNTIEGSRNRVLTLIDKLKNESLLLDGDKAGYVKIHDVVRDISTTIAWRVHYAFVGKGHIRSTDLESKDYKRISLPFCDIPALPEFLQCPQAEVFSMFVRDPSLVIPDLFFEGATKLKVLHFTGVSFVSGLPSSLGFLTGLQTLSLNGCKLINVAIVAELKQLEILSFAGSDIKRLPREIEALTRLKLLDLTDCYKLRVIPSNVLTNFHFLEELYVLSKYDRWDKKGNASLVELKNLSRLKTLEIKVRNDEFLPEDWFFNGIQNYKILIGYWNLTDANEKSRILALELKTSVGLMDRIKEFMGGAEVLYLRETDGIENLLYGSSMDHKINSFQRLRLLNIYKCNSLREVFPSISGRSGMVAFPNITSLTIYGCKSLKYVFTTPMANSLKRLKELQIRECELREEIISVTKFEEDTINVIVFPELDFLVLSRLPNLKRFSSGYRFEFPKLTELEITTSSEINEYLFKDVVIPNVEVLRLDKHSLKAITQSDHHGFPSESIWKLKEATFSNLEQGTIPVLFDFPRRIYSVEKLVFNRGSVGEIFSLGDERATGDQQQQHNLGLKHLDLQGVSKLKHIVTEDSKLDPVSQCFQTLGVYQCCDVMNIAPSSASFINLTILEVYLCNKMTSLVTASTAKTMVQLKELKVQNCKLMEHIIVANEDDREYIEEHVDVISFDKLKHLRLNCLPALNSFCSANYSFNFPLLEQVSIRFSHQMKIFCGGVVSTPKLQCEGSLNDIMQQNGSVEIPKKGGS